MPNDHKPVKRYALINDTGTWTASMREMGGGAYMLAHIYDRDIKALEDLNRPLTISSDAWNALIEESLGRGQVIAKQAATIARIEAERDVLKGEAEQAAVIMEAQAAENKRLRDGLTKCAAHTGLPRYVTVELLSGLLTSIKRIVDAALATESPTTAKET